MLTWFYQIKWHSMSSLTIFFSIFPFIQPDPNSQNKHKNQQKRKSKSKHEKSSNKDYPSNPNNLLFIKLKYQLKKKKKVCTGNEEKSNIVFFLIEL